MEILGNDDSKKYYIHEDAQHQMIIVDSPISGPMAFEFNPDRDQWTSDEYFLQKFLSEELLKSTDGFLNII